MNLRETFLKLILAPDQKEVAPLVYRNQVMRGVIALIMLTLSIVYTTVDSLNEVYHTVPYYYAFMVAAGIVIYLNRTGHPFAANIILLLAINLMTTAFSLSGGNVYVFFVPCGMAAITLFDYNDRLVGWVFVLFTLTLFVFSTYSDLRILPVGHDSPFIIQTNYLLNFGLAFGSSCFLLYSLVNLNFITEKEVSQKDAEIKNSRLRYELAIKGSNAGIYEWNVVTNEVFNSAIWKKMLGYDSKELPNLTLERFLEKIHPEHRAFVSEAVRLHLTERIPYQVEFQIQKKDGSYLWVRDSGLAVWDNEGRPQLWVGSLADISASKENERRILEQNELLAKANTELDQFVYHASHDLRSPLSSILGLVNIGKRSGTPLETLHCLELIEQRVKAQDTLIKDIIDYSRNARTNVGTDRILLRELVHETIELNRYALGAQEIDFQILIDDQMEIVSDRNRLVSVLDNLVNNAIKYRSEAKQESFINIAARNLEGGIEIIVEDNGIGIKEDLKDKVFEMFYRATEMSKGSGLGLFIVKEMVEKLNGKVTLFSELGKGSTFKVFLPNT